MSILPDQTARFLAHSPVALSATLRNLPSIYQLVEGLNLFFIAGKQPEAIALIKHACEAWELEQNELEEPKWQ